MNSRIQITLSLPVMTDVVVEGRPVVVYEEDGKKFWALRDTSVALEVDFPDDQIDDLVNDDDRFEAIDAACEMALDKGTIKALGEEGEPWKDTA